MQHKNIKPGGTPNGTDLLNIIMVYADSPS